MIELDDCGKRLHFDENRFLDDPGVNVTVSMVIKAPRGVLALFRSGESLYRHFVYEAQGKAIKAFMEDHQND